MRWLSSRCCDFILNVFSIFEFLTFLPSLFINVIYFRFSDQFVFHPLLYSFFINVSLFIADLIESITAFAQSITLGKIIDDLHIS